MNIMLLTDIPPCTNFTAGIVLNIMCDFLLEEGHNLCCFTVKHPDVDAVIPVDKLKRMKFETTVKPRENWGTSPLKGVGSWLGNNYVSNFVLPQISKKAIDFALKNKAELIWGVVQGHTMIKLLRPVATKAKIPYIVQVWDPPEWWLMENKFDRFTTASVMKEFGKLLRHSKSCIAASWAMAEEYQSLYKVSQCIPVILGFSSEKPISKNNKKNDVFVIAFSGQIYATQEYYALIDALNELNWHYQGKKIILRLYGRYFNLFFKQPSNIEVRGWVEQNELLSELKDADLLYCPYWFDKKYEQPCRLSFPSKLSTYLKTGTPVFFHGPDYASPKFFLEKYNAAYICGTLDYKKIAKLIKDIIDDPERIFVGERGYKAFLNNFTLDIMKKSFLKTLT